MDSSKHLQFRFATPDAAEILGRLNQQLIRDEGHRNPMNLSQMTDRMEQWLQGEYQAVLIEDCFDIIGYALFRREPDYVYLRQFFVVAERRRQGIGRKTLRWLWQHAWKDSKRLRIEVLAGNAQGRAFWKALGFHEYCVTMEATPPDDE